MNRVSPFVLAIFQGGKGAAVSGPPLDLVAGDAVIRGVVPGEGSRIQPWSAETARFCTCLSCSVSGHSVPVVCAAVGNVAVPVAHFTCEGLWIVF